MVIPPPGLSLFIRRMGKTLGSPETAEIQSVAELCRAQMGLSRPGLGQLTGSPMTRIKELILLPGFTSPYVCSTCKRWLTKQNKYRKRPRCLQAKPSLLNKGSVGFKQKMRFFKTLKGRLVNSVRGLYATKGKDPWIETPARPIQI